MTQKRLRESVRKFSQAKEPRVDIIDGELGIPLDGRKIVEVPGRAGFVYVRIRGNQSELIQAYNASVSPIYGLPVLLSRDGNIYKVISRNLDRYRDWGNTPYLPKHGFQHSFNHELGMGADITWVYSQQFMPMLAYPSGTDGSMFLSVSPYFYEYNNQWKYSQSTGTPSFTPYLPSGSQSVMCLLYVKPSDNSLQIAAGSQFSNSITGSAQIAQYIPSVSGEDVIPLAAVRLASGTTGLLWDAVYDVRKFLHPISSAGGGGGGGLGVMGWNEGIPLGTGTILNFVGDNVDASISGSVLRIFVTGSSTGGTSPESYINIGKVGIANEQSSLRLGQKTNGVFESFHTLGRSPVTNPVIPTGTTTDLHIREIGNIIYEPWDADKPYKTLYTGYQVAEFTDERIHYAYSRDGLNWTKYSGNPVISRRSEDPYVVKYQGVYYLYVEDTADASYSKVRRYHSTDFINWTDDGQITGISDTASPIVWIENGTWYLIYEHFPTAPNDIRLATSSDGLAWTNDGSNPIFDATDSAWLNDAAATVPDDIIKFGSTYYMSYHGASNYYGVGVAKSTNLTSWTDLGQILSADTNETIQHLQFIYDDEGLAFLYWADNYPAFDDNMGIYFGYAIDPTLTISSDAITVLSDFYFLTSQSGSSDNLATINGGRYGQVLVLKATSGHTITIKHNSGNIYLNGESDFSISGNKSIALFCHGANWSDVGAGSAQVVQPQTPLVVQDDGNYLASGTVISFDNNLNLGLSGTVIHVSSPVTTYFRVGQPTPLSTPTGTFWAVPDRVYASGSLGVFNNGHALIPGIDYVEQLWVSGTYQYLLVQPTGTYHLVHYGVPCIPQTQPATGSSSQFWLQDSDSVDLHDSDDTQLLDSNG